MDWVLAEQVGQADPVAWGDRPGAAAMAGGAAVDAGAAAGPSVLCRLRRGACKAEVSNQSWVSSPLPAPSVFW